VKENIDHTLELVRRPACVGAALTLLLYLPLCVCAHGWPRAEMDPQWTVPKALRDKYEERFRRIKNAHDVVPSAPPPRAHTRTHIARAEEGCA
jgi:hypothetical protein